MTIKRDTDACWLIHGWTIFTHPIFVAELERLTAQVSALREKYPRSYGSKNPSKRLAAIKKLAFDVIPQDPARSEYRQGMALGESHKHWFRAKFFQQYRLFFRYRLAGKIIVYGWVNNDDSKRAYGDDDDAYRVFRQMLDRGRPPDDWDMLLDEARSAAGRTAAAPGGHGPDLTGPV